MLVLLGFFWMITILATGVAFFVLFVTFARSSGAPQEAAGAALAVAIVVIPYVFSRACQAMYDADRQAKILDVLRQLGPRADLPVRSSPSERVSCKHDWTWGAGGQVCRHCGAPADEVRS
jgi:hypothetical protein